MTDLHSPKPQGPGSEAGTPAGGTRRRFAGSGGRKALVVVALVGSFFAGGVLFSHMHAVGEETHLPPWLKHAAWMGGPVRTTITPTVRRHRR